MYFYDSHLGGFYSSDYFKDYDELYCETCGDSDTYLGSYENAINFLSSFRDDIDVDGSGGYDLEYTLSQLSCFEDCPTFEGAVKQIREWRENDKNNNHFHCL